jgi:hypothetical protein
MKQPTANPFDLATNWTEMADESLKNNDPETYSKLKRFHLLKRTLQRKVENARTHFAAQVEMGTDPAAAQRDAVRTYILTTPKDEVEMPLDYETEGAEQEMADLFGQHLQTL